MRRFWCSLILFILGASDLLVLDLWLVIWFGGFLLILVFELLVGWFLIVFFVLACICVVRGFVCVGCFNGCYGVGGFWF